MKYLLDTNICIYLINRNNERLIKRIERELTKDLAISVITLAELEYGVHNSKHVERNQAALINFLAPISILSFETEDAEQFGQIKSELKRRGRLISDLDILIAAQVMTRKLTLISNNIREFNRIPQLRVENWVTG